MSRYEIARSCGCTETVNITGPNSRGQRERRAAQLAQWPCGACAKQARDAQRAELSERALALAKLAGWPNLQGTPRQVPWVTEIRASMLAEVVARICDPRPAELGAAVGVPGVEDFRYAGHLRGEEIVAVYVTAALRQVDVRWWIDRQGLAKRIRGPVDMVEDAGVARHQYGGLLAAIEATMTDSERAEVAALAA